MPNRIQLSRAKGWRMPENAVKVDRSTKWGNPFIVGKDGTRAECVDLYCKMLRGYTCLTNPGASIAEQKAARKYILSHIRQLRGHDLACWCPIGQACHADVLLKLAEACDG